MKVHHLNGGTMRMPTVDSVEDLAGPEDRRDYSFGNLMDIAPGDQGGFEVTARTAQRLLQVRSPGCVTAGSAQRASAGLTALRQRPAPARRPR